MAGPMTEGVLRGLAIRQQREEAEARAAALKENQERQLMLGASKTLAEIVGMKRNLRGPMLDQFSADYSRLTGGREIAPAIIEMIKKGDEDDARTFGQMIQQMGIEIKDPKAVLDLLGDPYKAMDYALKFHKAQQEGKAAETQQKIGSSFKGALSAMAPPEPAPAEVATGPEDLQLRTGPAGEALGLPASPAPAPRPVATGPAPAQRAPSTPEEALGRIAIAEQGLFKGLQTALESGQGLSTEMRASYESAREQLNKQRDYFVNQIKEARPSMKETTVTRNGIPTRILYDEKDPRAPQIPLGPTAEVGAPHSPIAKLQSDRRNLIAMGAGESSPAVRQYDRLIAAAEKEGDQAQSPLGKAQDDYQRAIRLYGPGSEQVAQFKQNLTDLTEGGQVTQSDVHNMRAEFSRLSHDYLSVRDARDRIRSVATDFSQAGDLALLTSYMKLIDPSTGVREGELATASNAASIPERIVGLYNRLLTTKGGRMSEEMRKDFTEQAEKLYASHERNQRALEEQFRGIAKSQRMNPDQVVLKFITNPQGVEDATREYDKARKGLQNNLRILDKELETGPTPSRRR